MLETRGVTKRFAGLTAVERVDLALQVGEIRGIVGPNGAGKTTLFNVISGLYAPEAGRVVLDGADVTRWPAYARARGGLGRTYQTPQVFFDLSVFDNVVIGLACVRPPAVAQAVTLRRRARAEIAREVEELLAFVGLPAGLETRAGGLTFAAQKRLELARVLMGRPRVILLDEPAAGLNRAEVVSLDEVIRRVRDRGITVCLIEHNMRLVMGMCDTVTVLDFGRKIAEGSPGTVRTDPQVIAAYLGRKSDAEL